MPNLPTVFKTNQDVKYNLVYWTTLLLSITVILFFLLFLDDTQRIKILEVYNQNSTNVVITTLAVPTIVAIVTIVAWGLIFFLHIHDYIYDAIFIKWRESFDTKFIIPKLTHSFRDALPKNFEDYIRKYREIFMKPYYSFVGDGKEGIEENTRIRFYERVTAYWITQINEIFIICILLVTPIVILFKFAPGLDINNYTILNVVLVLLFLGNRYLIRVKKMEVEKATQDEIDEILEKPKNISLLYYKYTALLAEYRL